LGLGTVACLCGRKGTGKSSVAAALAADVSGGPRIKGGRPRPLGHVLWYAAEEPTSTATQPRLAEAGADLDQVSFLGVDRSGRLERRLSLPGDLWALQRTVVDSGARLLVLDPWTGCLSSGLSLNDEQSLRTALEPLAALADATGCTVLLIGHVRKEGHGPALDQVLGGVAVVNISRSVLRCDTHPDRPERYLLSHVASNVGLAPTLEFSIAGPVAGAGAVHWHGESALDAETLAEGIGDSGDRDESADARQLLRRRLDAGRVPAKEMLGEALAAGISQRTLRRAKAKLHVPSYRTRTGAGSVGYWEWGPPAGGWPEGV